MSKNKLVKGLLASAGAIVALAGCSVGSPSADTVNKHAENYDKIDEGELVVEYGLDSKQYGDFYQKSEGKFKLREGFEDEELEDEELEDKKVSLGLVKTVKADEKPTIEEDIKGLDEEEYEEYLEGIDFDGLTEEDVEVLLAKDAELYGDTRAELISEEDTERREKESLKYNYEIVEESTVSADGRENTAKAEIVALEDTFYDRVYLTGSEADGKYVYGERGQGIDEYPMDGYVNIKGVVKALDLDKEGVELTKGKMNNGENGVIFTLDAEDVEVMLTEADEYTELSSQILSLATEKEVDELEFSINDNSISVIAKSTSTGSKDEQTSEVEEDVKEEKEEDREVGYLHVTKTKSTVDIKEPAGNLSVEEFQTIVERFYEEISEEEVGLDEEELEEEDEEELEEDEEDIEVEIKEVEVEEDEEE